MAAREYYSREDNPPSWRCGSDSTHSAQIRIHRGVRMRSISKRLRRLEHLRLGESRRGMQQIGKDQSIAVWQAPPVVMLVSGAARSFVATPFPNRFSVPVDLADRLVDLGNSASRDESRAACFYSCQGYEDCPRLPPMRAGSRATLGNPSYFQSCTTLPLRSMRRVILSAPEKST